jgi:hypothetical protein
MERMLQYVWKHRLYSEEDFKTPDGTRIYVLDPGLANMDAGPDFFNAKIRIGATIWVGNAEIHEQASEWFLHNHHTDKLYDNVILHVVRQDDCKVYNANNEEVMQVVMPVPQKVEDNIEWLLTRDTPVPCEGRLQRISPIYLSDWLTTLLMERLERKTKDILARHTNKLKDWNETFYITLMRNFGFGTNSDIFEMLAKSLPFKHILQHRNNPLQIEALLFGQAGLLGNEAGDDAYVQSLRQEYEFLRKKYNLKPVEGFLFKSLRTRPVNFPHVRLAQAAALWLGNDVLFSKILEAEDINAIRNCFNVSPSAYWLTHYNFRSEAGASKKKAIGRNATDIILINTVIPVLFAYGKAKKQPEYCEKALRFLEQLPAERNNIVSLFRKAGIEARNAGDSQSLIQLRREYCDKKKCLYCRIGYRVIGNWR